jgi:outer membrane OprD family porin
MRPQASRWRGVAAVALLTVSRCPPGSEPRPGRGRAPPPEIDSRPRIRPPGCLRVLPGHTAPAADPELLPEQRGSPDVFQEARAAGGWIAYQSSWLRDTFSIGATGYFSLPVYAPDDRDGTLLLKPGQDPIAALGEAWAKLRYGAHVLTGYRQLLNIGYVNPQDNRMIPNTFEAVMLDGKVVWLDYHVGYLFGVKPRTEDRFLSMAEQAGAADSDTGLILAGLRVTPWRPLAIETSTAYGIDTYNSAFLQADYTVPLADRIALTVGAQYHDQRSVGDELVGRFDTWNVGTHARLAVWDASIELMFNQTGDGATILSRYGAISRSSTRTSTARARPRGA